MKRITVAHLIPRIPAGGGAENLLVDIIRSMDSRRFRIIVFYWREGDDLLPLMRAAGAEVVRLPIGKGVSLFSVLKLARALKERGVDVLHTHFMDSDLLGFFASLMTGIRIFVHVHSYSFPQTRRHALRYRCMGPWLGRIICVSAFVRRRVMALTRIQAQKVVVVPNGIDIESFSKDISTEEKHSLRQELGLVPGSPVIGAVARLSSEKSLETLLRAAPHIFMRYPHARIIIAGNGPEEASLKALARDLKVMPQVVFTGLRRDVAALLGIMDVFVLPSTGEAFGISILEAFASGVPVVVSDVCAIPELVRHGKEGLLFPPRDERGLADAVIRLLDDPLLAKNFAAAGAVRVHEFTAQAMCRKLEALYAEALPCD